MPVPSSYLGEPSVTGPVGSLALSCVRPLASALALRVVRWHEGLGRLGVTLPFFVVHDVGLVLAVPSEHYERGPRAPVAQLAGAPAKLGALLVSYSGLLDELAEGEVAKRAAELKMSDDLVIVVLSRLLGGVATELAGEATVTADLPADAAIFEALEPQLVSLFGRTKRTFELRALEALDAGKLFVLTVADALDIDTLRLFGMVGSDAAAGAIAQVDMLAALESPEANDIVNFSLELLPSVLETKARPAAGLTASHGYSGIATRGSIDSMVLTELAWDDLELARRITDNEVLYYAREQSHEEQHRVHTLLVDASASMRGERTTFARGMAIATGKKLLLEGDEVVVRFFDSRLYEAHRAHKGQLPTAMLLSFRGERGRNPSRVFAELATELDLARMRDGRTQVVHLFTHAALYIPRALVEAVASHAHLSAVFILPSSGGELDLDYLDLLRAHWVVDHRTLAGGQARADAARSILGESSRGDPEREPASARGATLGGAREPARDLSRGGATPQRASGEA